MSVFFASLQSDTEPPSRGEVYMFTAKCVLGLAICYWLYILFPKYPFDWAMISVVLCFSFDNSKKFAIERMVSNTHGCVIGLILFPLPLPHLLLLSVGVIMIISTALFFKLTDMIRQSLAAFVIVMLREENSQLWFIPVHRVITVMAGCVVALLLTLAFSFFVPLKAGANSN